MKLIQVKVIPNAKKNEVREENEKLIVRVSAPASDNKANKMLVEILAGYFSVKKSSVRIVKGGKSRDKIIEID